MQLPAGAATITVTGTGDSIAVDGSVTLREALTSANNNANVNADVVAVGAYGTDTIAFDISGSGVRSITPLSALPDITGPIVIDGYTQPGSIANSLAVGNNSNHLIELNGNGAIFKALIITAGGSTVRGLVINNFNGNGNGVAITLQTGGGNTVVGCFLGLNAAGTAAATNRDFGVDIESSPNNNIGGMSPADRNVISGNITGIQINSPASSGTTIQGNYIGTNAAGTAALTNSGVSLSDRGIGVNYSGGASFNLTIGGSTVGARNVISGNASANIALSNLTITGIVPAGCVIQGNYIGTNAAGTAGLNFGTGISLTRFTNVAIGGTGAGQGNVISGNSGAGIDIANGDGPTGAGNTIHGNLIGTNAAGTAAVPNIVGVSINGGQNNTVGGTVPGARNVISGNSNYGLGIISGGGPDVTANLVQGNFIGTDITGTTKIGNGASGVIVLGAYGFVVQGTNTIGGLVAGARNLISGIAGDGVAIASASNTLVEGNYIGTDVTGAGNLGNDGYGVTMSAADNNTIGGTVAGAGNVIAFNGSTFRPSGGVGVLGGTGNSIFGNSIFSNSGGDPAFSNPGLGINLFSNGELGGVTPNDLGDADTGPNNLQNFPIITGLTSASGSVTLTGTLNSEDDKTYRLEFFANTNVDLSGYGEGQTFLGFKEVTTDGSGDASFSASFPVVGNPVAFTATATDPDGNTSEFSAAFTTKLLNISTRMQVLTSDNVLIGGFIVTGVSPKRVIVRAIGPALSDFGVPGALMDPILELNAPDGSVTTNDNWKDDQQTEIAATGLQPSNDAESAIVQSLVPGAYTAIVRGAGGTTGVGLVEAYDLDQPAGSKLANISTRGFIDTGDNVMIGGFIIGPADLGDATVLVRAIGPSLANSGVANALQDPVLELHDGNGGTIRTNDNWRDDQETEISATGLMPTDDAESAILQTLAPGNYTAIVRGVANTTGVGLVEVYDLQ
ncbi:MAG: beta strand repeat-containing protein [Chthoniobacterales bacterium]